MPTHDTAAAAILYIVLEFMRHSSIPLSFLPRIAGQADCKNCSKGNDRERIRILSSILFRLSLLSHSNIFIHLKEVPRFARYLILLVQLTAGASNPSRSTCFSWTLQDIEELIFQLELSGEQSISVRLSADPNKISLPFVNFNSLLLSLDSLTIA